MGQFDAVLAKAAQRVAVAAEVSLADRINAVSVRIATRVGNALEDARECGRLLVEAKAEAGHGSFGQWVKDNLRFGIRQAQNYMRLHNHWHRLPHQQTMVERFMEGGFQALLRPLRTKAAQTSGPQELPLAVQALLDQFRQGMADALRALPKREQVMFRRALAKL